jgi:hypothetical protein
MYIDIIQPTGGKGRNKEFAGKGRNKEFAS